MHDTNIHWICRNIRITILAYFVVPERDSVVQFHSLFFMYSFIHLHCLIRTNFINYNGSDAYNTTHHFIL